MVWCRGCGVRVWCRGCGERVWCEGVVTVLHEALTGKGSRRAVLPLVGRVFCSSELH